MPLYDNARIKWISGKTPHELSEGARPGTYMRAVSKVVEFFMHPGIIHGREPLFQAAALTMRGDLQRFEALPFGPSVTRFDSLGADIALLNGLMLVFDAYDNDIERSRNVHLLPFLLKETGETLKKWWEREPPHRPEPSAGGIYTLFPRPPSPFELLLEKTAPLLRRLDDARDSIHQHYGEEVALRAVEAIALVPLRIRQRPKVVQVREARP